MEKLTYTSQVELYLSNLIDSLFLNEYFGFKSSAYEYVDDLLLKIEEGIRLRTEKNSPKKLKELGSSYLSFNTNPRTTWYVFFNKLNSEIHDTYIFNNHEKFAQYLDL
ncbi:MAG: hypothetical protein JNL75_09795 [Chitinophagales bacterium]|nr:hypothetical protein [Chitinophagales bacterium]